MRNSVYLSFSLSLSLSLWTWCLRSLFSRLLSIFIWFDCDCAYACAIVFFCFCFRMLRFDLQSQNMNFRLWAAVAQTIASCCQQLWRYGKKKISQKESDKIEICMAKRSRIKCVGMHIKYYMKLRFEFDKRKQRT